MINLDICPIPNPTSRIYDFFPEMYSDFCEKYVFCIALFFHFFSICDGGLRIHQFMWDFPKEVFRSLREGGRGRCVKMPGKSYEVYVQKGTPLWKVIEEKDKESSMNI